MFGCPSSLPIIKDPPAGENRQEINATGQVAVEVLKFRSQPCKAREFHACQKGVKQKIVESGRRREPRDCLTRHPHAPI
jgi:hypothetical protein